jgi:uncharacterized integral membrane protein (TIGR00697 family)
MFMKQDNSSSRELVLLVLLGLYVSVLVAANAAGTKIVAIGPLAASATVYAYALSFLITDVVAEVYGKKDAKRFVTIGFLAVVVAVAFFQIAIASPAASFYQDSESFRKVLGTTWRFLIGGAVAFLVSQSLDIRLFHYFKKVTKGRWLWLRNNLSTMISQLVDTMLFVTIALYGVVDNLLLIILGQYIVKLLIAALDTPLVYLAVSGVRRFVPDRSVG